jgi:hypothetical protein
MNSHDWYGVISNFHKDISDKFGFDFGVDARTYKGYHYRIVNDDLGADGYNNTYKDLNNPDMLITEYYEAKPNWNPFVDIKGQQKIEYYNVGGVHWIGAFGQLEYKSEAVSTFLQFGVSQQGFQRTDYFNLGKVAHENNPDIPEDQVSDWENLLGGNVKTGLNYNINEHHNVFVNAGYYSKQPLFSAVYPNYTNNDINEDLVNETIIGFELGYGYKGERTRFNLNLYRTSWADRFKAVGFLDEATGDYGSARMNGITQLHLGVEMDASYRPIETIEFNAMISAGDWTYSGNPYGKLYNDDNELLSTIYMHLDDVKVGDAAQFTSRLGMQWELFDNFKIDVNQFMVDQLYADLDVKAYLVADINNIPEDHSSNKGALRLPAYSLTNAGASYKFKLGEKMGLKLRFNVNNLGNHIYISESETNIHAEEGDATWQGINTSNRVFFGFGRTWNFSTRFNF